MGSCLEAILEKFNVWVFCDQPKVTISQGIAQSCVQFHAFILRIVFKLVGVFYFQRMFILLFDLQKFESQNSWKA